ncbi:hypothetical protein C1I95_20410, partial [Micromonospora craterilacus]
MVATPLVLGRAGLVSRPGGDGLVLDRGRRPPPRRPVRPEGSAVTADVVELTEQSTEDVARARAARIRQGMRTFLETVAELALAWERRDWQTLGYSGWQSYLDAEFGAERLKVPTVLRQQAVEILRAAFMSQRAIAAALGVGQSTVRDDLALLSGSTQLPDRIKSLDGRDLPATRPTP